MDLPTLIWGYWRWDAVPGACLRCVPHPTQLEVLVNCGAWPQLQHGDQHGCGDLPEVQFCRCDVTESEIAGQKKARGTLDFRN